MEIDAVRAFCHSICGENDHEQAVYVRIRTGAAKSRATTVVSGLDASDVSPLQLAYDLERRYVQLRSEVPVWIEALLEGTSKVIDCVKLPPYQEEELDGSSTPLQPLDYPGVFVALIDSNTQLTQDANRRCSELMQLYNESQLNNMKMFHALSKAHAEIMIHEHIGDKDAMDTALEVLAPILPALAAKVGGKPAEPPPLPEPSPGEEVDYELAADQMIDGLAEIARQRPDLITSDRITKLVSLV